MDAPTEPRSDGKWVIRISRTKFIITLVVVAIAALLWVGLVSMNTARYSGVGVPSSGMLQPQGMGYSESTYNSYYPDYQQPSITDTREFLKTSYSATIKTRDVSGVITDVKNIVKGADGRIDSSYSSEKGGRVSFVVAKSKFDAFRDQVEAITHRKLYSESISSENLLTQKQGIEQQTSTIVSTLQDLQKQNDALVARHNQEVVVINSELSRIKTELASVRSNIAENIDPLAIASLRSQESSLVAQDATQRQKLSAENSSYAAQKQNLDTLVANYNSNLITVNKQDIQFTDTIETVSGTVYVQWVSYWQIATIFSPVSPVIILVVLAIIVWIYLKRKGYAPGVEWAR